MRKTKDIWKTHLQTQLSLFLCMKMFQTHSAMQWVQLSAAGEMHNNSCFYTFIFRTLFLTLSFISLFVILSTHQTVSPKPPPTSPLYLPLIPSGQQCSSSVVSIIIVQSVLVSTNCQHSTNARLAINAIFLSSSHYFSDLLSFLPSPVLPCSHFIFFPSNILG